MINKTFPEFRQLEVRNARNGKGLFTNTKIEKNIILFKTIGVIVKDTYDPDYNYGERWLGVNKETWLKVSADHPMYYMNHSCNPNCSIINRIEIVTLRNIEPYEEITFDYSLTEEDPYWQMNCNCGYESCRKKIFGTAKF